MQTVSIQVTSFDSSVGQPAHPPALGGSRSGSWWVWVGAPGLNTHSPELPWAMPAFGPEWMDTQAPLDPGMYREPSGPWFREPLKKVNTGRCVGHQQSWMLVCKDGSCSWRPRQLLVTRLTLRGWGGGAVCGGRWGCRGHSRAQDGVGWRRPVFREAWARGEGRFAPAVEWCVWNKSGG